MCLHLPTVKTLTLKMSTMEIYSVKSSTRAVKGLWKFRQAQDHGSQAFWIMPSFYNVELNLIVQPQGIPVLSISAIF